MPTAKDGPVPRIDHAGSSHSTSKSAGLATWAMGGAIGGLVCGLFWSADLIVLGFLGLGVTFAWGDFVDGDHGRAIKGLILGSVLAAPFVIAASIIPLIIGGSYLEGLSNGAGWSLEAAFSTLLLFLVTFTLGWGALVGGGLALWMPGRLDFGRSVVWGAIGALLGGIAGLLLAMMAGGGSAALSGVLVLITTSAAIPWLVAAKAPNRPFGQGTVLTF